MDLSKLFQQVLLLSIMGSVLAMGILLIKSIFKQKLSARFHYYIWFVLVLRLLIPISFQSSLSVFNLIPAQQQKNDISSIIEQNFPNILAPKPNINTNITQVNTVTNDKENNLATMAKGLGFNYKTTVLVWIMGVLIILLYIFAVNIILLIKLKKRPHCERKDIIEILEETKTRLSVNSRISVVYDLSLKSPAVYGLLRPKILISEEIINRLSSDELNFVFLHEVTHIKRKDLFINTVVMMIQVMYWFNPLIWYSLYQMKQDCEVACDSTALTALNSEDVKKYGQTIINMMQILAESHWIPGTLGFASKYSKRRIIMISLFKKTSITWTILALSLTLMVGCSSLAKPTSSNTTNTSDQNEVSNISDTNPVLGTVKPVPASDNNTAKDSNNDSTKNSPQQEESQVTLLGNIKKLAEQGKIINCDFPVKTTVIDDVEKKWGKPDKSDWVPQAKGIYNTYSKYNVVFGFNKGSQIFEVRSFDSGLGKISLSMVKKTFGAPAYDVNSNGQEIIGYTAGKEYKILFVFPQPEKGSTDPLMDHYSVFYPRGTVNMMADDPGRQW